MFYETATNDHGLPHDPFKALVSPRPIGWIGSRGRDGTVNLAPYSFFNALSDRPKLVMFSSIGRKDSLRNIEETGVFTASLVSLDLVEKMNATSVPAPYGVNEFDYAGLTMAEGRLVPAPYVAEARAALEIRVTEILVPKTLDGTPAQATVVIGQVVGIHIDDGMIRDGRIDMAVAAPVARLGYMDYSESSTVFALKRPQWRD